MIGCFEARTGTETGVVEVTNGRMWRIHIVSRFRQANGLVMERSLAVPYPSQSQQGINPKLQFVQYPRETNDNVPILDYTFHYNTE